MTYTYHLRVLWRFKLRIIQFTPRSQKKKKKKQVCNDIRVFFFFFLDNYRIERVIVMSYTNYIILFKYYFSCVLFLK